MSDTAQISKIASDLTKRASVYASIARKHPMSALLALIAAGYAAGEIASPGLRHDKKYHMIGAGTGGALALLPHVAKSL